MNHRFFGLLVHDRPAPLDSLRSALKYLSVDTCEVRSCKEAKQLLRGTHPDLVFTDTTLADGSWTDVLEMARDFYSPANVIVVGSNEDIKLYLSALERGAFDFLLPPFERQALAYVVRSAGEDARDRRHTQVLAAA